MAGRELAVLIGGRLAGTLSQQPQTEFRYNSEYASDPAATPLSVSMPLGTGTFRQSTALPWIDGLLPDNREVRDRWGAHFRVSGRNPFALLTHMGRDCPGGVQICRPEDIDEVAAQTGELVPVNDSDIARRLDSLRSDNTAWTVEGERWSLGGAQSKFALAWSDEGWSEARGSRATTHIVKPGISQYRSHGLNEHLTMTAARLIGLRAAHTEYREFDGRPAVVIARYDRVRSGSDVRRIHQEDLTQAMSVARHKKYEEHGGPGAAAIVDLLRSNTTPEDVWRFAEALAFSYLVKGPDGHAKNYSLLLSGNQVRLAPLYDISSALPYDSVGDSSALDNMAMAIGGERKFGGVTEANWIRFANRTGIDPAQMIDRVKEMATQLPDALSTALRQTAATDTELGTRYLDRLTTNARRIAASGKVTSRLRKFDEQRVED